MKKLGISLSHDVEQFINGISMVRNIFTHCNGYLDKVDSDKIKNLINFSKHNGVNGLIIDNREKEIIISLDFIDYCMAYSKKYFMEILK